MSSRTDQLAALLLTQLSLITRGLILKRKVHTTHLQLIVANEMECLAAEAIGEEYALHLFALEDFNLRQPISYEAAWHLEKALLEGFFDDLLEKDELRLVMTRRDSDARKLKSQEDH